MFTEIRITHASCTVKEKSTYDILKYFSHLFHKTGFDISCKLSPKKILFSEKKSIIKLLSVEFALSVVTVKLETIF